MGNEYIYLFEIKNLKPEILVSLTGEASHAQRMA